MENLITDASHASTMTKKFTLILLSLWWGWTALIDFAVVPTVFRTIHDFFNAGELGIALFSKLNILELILAPLLIFLFWGKSKWRLGLVITLSLIVIFYASYLTPKITQLTELWKKAEALNQLGISDIRDIQQEHQFFHKLYVALDTVKLLVLSFLIGDQVAKA